MAAASWYRWEGDVLILSVRVQPRASRDELAGVQGERLKVRITASPVEGEANAHLVRFLAERFRVAKSQITLLDGESSRAKRLAIRGPRALPPAIAPPSRT
jgi:uncharacterized protein